MLKLFIISLMFAALLLGAAYMLYTIIKEIIDCMPDYRDEED